MKPEKWRWMIRDMPLDPVSKTVAWALESRMNSRGVCWPSKTRLADDTGYSHRTVDRAIRRLEIFGVLTVRRRPPAPNLYTARLPRHSDGVTGDGVTPSETTFNPVTGDGGRQKKRNIEEVAHASQVDQAMVELARGWLAVH